jgi:hypothetical protein
MSAIDQDVIDMGEKGTEMDFYFIINECGGFIWRMNHDLADDRITLSSDPEEKARQIASIDRDIERMREIQKYMVSKLTKFGFISTDVDSKPTEDYWKWFRWWDGYIRGMSQEQWRELDRKLTAKEDVSAYKPEGDWRKPIEV